MMLRGSSQAGPLISEGLDAWWYIDKVDFDSKLMFLLTFFSASVLLWPFGFGLDPQGISSTCSFDPIDSHQRFYDCLRRGLSKPITSLSTRLILPHDPSYRTSTSNYNLAIQPNASAIVFVSDTREASEMIKCGVEYHVPITPRGGRHSYAGYGTGQASLVIDVSNLRKISFNSDGTRPVQVKVGAGLRVGDLASSISNARRAVSHGSHPHIGMCVCVLFFFFFGTAGSTDWVEAKLMFFRLCWLVGLIRQ